MESSTRFCDSCGAINRSDARFCYACGQPQLMYASATVTGLLTTSHQLKQRYTILEKLGQGGFGAVYKVEDTLFNNAIRAVKEMGMRGLSPQETQDAIASFKHEAQLLANLAHPHLPLIYDHFEAQGRWYLVMDYIEGETLAKRLNNALNGRIGVTEAIQIALQLCDVLGYLHAHQPPIVFRDLKPDNVMLSAGDRLYLIDFGIARFFKPGQTKDTMSLGTPGYASPEQYGRMQTTIRADIYSLGATLHHAISGINPGFNPFSFQPLALDPQIPGNAELEALISQMLEMKEEKRPQNTLIIADTLRRIQQVRGAALPSAPELAAPTPVTMKLQQTLIVAQEGGGDYTSLSEAVRHAVPGTLILVQKGFYKESLLLDRDIEIMGNGPKEEVILEASDNHAVMMRTSHASIRGLTIRCRATQGHALDISRGQLFVEDCDLVSEAATCVAIYNAETRPTIRYCAIHDSPANGIAIYQHAQGSIEYCDLFAHRQPALHITKGGNPTLRHCTIHDNQHHGVLVHDQGWGTLEDCELHHNTYAGIAITSGSNPLMLRCQLRHNQRCGIDVQLKGQGSFMDCAIFANADDNVRIASESTPYFYLCKIHDGEQCGVSVVERGRGIIEYCEIYANRSANVEIGNGGAPIISYSKIYQGHHSGVTALDGGLGTIEYCTITDNVYKAVDLAPNSNTQLKANHI